MKTIHQHIFHHLSQLPEGAHEELCEYLEFLSWKYNRTDKNAQNSISIKKEETSMPTINEKEQTQQNNANEAAQEDNAWDKFRTRLFK